MDVLEIFDGCPGNTLWVSWKYFMGVLETFDVCPGDSWCVSWII